mgnify:CR=1 FL=1
MKRALFGILAAFSLLAGAAQAQYGSRAHPVDAPAAVQPPRVLAAPELLAATSLNEGFDDIATLTGTGWVMLNQSSPVGSTNWFQGTATTATPTPGPFNAYDGAPNAYIAANFNNTGSTGTISNWLLTPELDFGGGATLTFYTRKPTIGAGQTDYPDRLEIRLSTAGASTNVGTGATQVGDFTTLLLSINPTLVANVYPQVWTQYTITNAEGLPRNGSGRVALRYFVTGAGSLGSYSDYIGIDRVTYAGGTPEYQVGGSVSGLAGSGLMLSLNGGTPLAVSADGTFQFPVFLASGASYAVAVSSQPTNPAQTCAVTNGSGTIGSANVTDVQVNCTTNTYTVGGTVTGFAGSGLVLQNNAGDDWAVSANGAFTFATPVASGGTYAVTVLTQPTNPSQTCAVTNGSGNIGGTNVTNVQVNCATVANLMSVSGSGQSATFGNAFAETLVVKVTDSEGTAMASVDVTFSAPPTGASAVLADGVQVGSATLTVQSDANGVAIVMATANAIAGCYGVVATSPSAPSAAIFELTNIDPATLPIDIFEDGFEMPPPGLKIQGICLPD